MSMSSVIRRMKPWQRSPENEPSVPRRCSGSRGATWAAVAWGCTLFQRRGFEAVPRDGNGCSMDPQEDHAREIKCGVRSSDVLFKK